MTLLSKKNNIRIKPHMKTHKNLYLANLQFKSGAIGFTCAKIDEVICFLRAGFFNITLAMPHVNESKLKRLFTEIQFLNSNLYFTVDHVEQIRVLQNIFKKIRIKRKPKILLKIDVGLHRCGVSESNMKVIKNIILNLSKIPEILEFRGLISHAGHSYLCKTQEQVEHIAQDEIDILSRIKEHLKHSWNVKVNEINIGATPTEWCRPNFKNFSEMKPGNYILNDKTPLKLGLCSNEEVACLILSQVISIHRNTFIVDAGSKVLSSDSGAHGISSNSFGQVWYTNKVIKKHVWRLKTLSEEHGWVERNLDNDYNNIKIGDFVWILPNHSCSVINLTNEFLLMRFNGKIKKLKQINARGFNR